MADPKIAELKADFPIFELKNKKNVAQTILLNDGESIVVPEQGIVKIASNNISYFPDFKVFEYLSPSLEKLASYDVIQRKNSSKPAIESKPETPPANPPSGNNQNK